MRVQVMVRTTRRHMAPSDPPRRVRTATGVAWWWWCPTVVLFLLRHGISVISDGISSSSIGRSSCVDNNTAVVIMTMQRARIQGS